MHASRNITIGLAIGFVLAVGIFSAAQFWFHSFPTVEPVRYGITFSTRYAEQLGLDPKLTYQALVEELGVQAVRIPIYWSDVEHEPNNLHWEMYDWLLDYSADHHVSVTLAIGAKVPRWPECYVPDWAESMETKEQWQHTRTFIAKAVERYRTSSAVERWQVENEAFFTFGECGEPLTLDEFDARIALVRSLDERPIQITVSGEFDPWYEAAKRADILGISMYRKSWNAFFGYFVYPIGPEFYQVRAQLIDATVDHVIVSELQAEPWFSRAIDSYSLDEAYALFTEEHFASNLSFVRRSGAEEAYLWGAEWWYYLKQHGDERLWNVATTIFP